MRSLTLCLIGFLSFFYDVTKHQASSYCVRFIKYQEMPSVRHYIQDGKAGAVCNDTLLMHQPYLTINGKKVPKLTAHIIRESQAVSFQTTLDRNTKLGEYRLHSGHKSVLLLRIGYILCDPSQVAPEKLCGRGQFCVINGSGTRCQQRLDCEMINTTAVECENGKPLRKSNSSCSGYNNAKTIPQGYYLGIQYKGTGCELEPRVFHKGQTVQYLSTIPVSDNHDLEPNAWNRTSRNIRCALGSEGMSPGNDFSLSSNPNIAWPESLPAKKYIICTLEEEKAIGLLTGFYILFYKKNVKFSIVQQQTNTTIDVTNTSKSEVWLDSPPPYHCTVSVSGGLFVKVLHTETSSTKEPNLGEDSIKLEDKQDRCTLVSCWAFVYFYEQMADQGFKELYREKREIVIRLKGTTMKGWVVALIVVCVILSLIVIGLVVAVTIFAIRSQRKDNRSKDDEAAIPDSLRSVKESQSGRHAVMSVDADGETGSISTSAAESEE